MPDDPVQHLLQDPACSLLRYPVTEAAQRNRQFGSKRFFLRRYGKGDVLSLIHISIAVGMGGQIQLFTAGAFLPVLGFVIFPRFIMDAVLMPDLREDRCV